MVDEDPRIAYDAGVPGHYVLHGGHTLSGPFDDFLSAYAVTPHGGVVSYVCPVERGEPDKIQRVYSRVLRARENLEAYLTLHGGREAEAVAPITVAVDHLDAILDELEFAAER